MIVETPTPNLLESIEFYIKLNFQVLQEDENAVVSDGSVVVLINSERTTRAGVKLYVQNKEAIINELQKENKFYGASKNVFSEPSGMRITLVDQSKKPKYESSKNEPSLLGSFAGVSLETPDMEKSLKVWKALGFEVTMGDVEQGWVALSNTSGDSISLMKPMACPHLFFNPSLTYFNGTQNISIIEGIRKTGITITEEISHFNPEGIVDNIIVRDPGGFGFFIFSD
ncbi:hypothetical protein N9176_01300 [bacterium]|nr:hypothetical protein [bacterium]